VPPSAEAEQRRRRTLLFFQAFIFHVAAARPLPAVSAASELFHPLGQPDKGRNRGPYGLAVGLAQRL
jgi:hypothetical protein